jgi:hypothetical protein
MPEDIWDDFPEAVEFTQDKRPMKRPSERDLDACEHSLGFMLPRSYRSFVKRFGAGHLLLDGCPGEWELWAPGNPRNRFNSSLEAHNGPVLAADPDEWSRRFTDPRRASRLILFASSPLSLDDYGWDREDITDPDGPEYGIYSRACKPIASEPLPRVAGSFRDFIMGYCLGRFAEEGGYTKKAEWERYGAMRGYHRH